MIIIKSYMNIKKILIIFFLIIVIFFTILEINKKDLAFYLLKNNKKI